MDPILRKQGRHDCRYPPDATGDVSDPTMQPENIDKLIETTYKNGKTTVSVDQEVIKVIIVGVSMANQIDPCCLPFRLDYYY